MKYLDPWVASRDDVNRLHRYGVAIFPAGFVLPCSGAQRSCLRAGIICRAIARGLTGHRSILWRGRFRCSRMFGRNKDIFSGWLIRVELPLVIHTVKKCENGDDDQHAKREHFGEWCDCGSPLG
jgi:hypothetical protein